MKNILLLGTLLALSGAVWGQVAPASTDFKSDVCEQCNMAVTNQNYAAQIVTTGKPLFFDDIGCLVQYERAKKIKAASIKVRYVRSVVGDAWVQADKAVWLTTKDVRTPMGYGLHAFADQKSADAFVKANKSAKPIAWKDVPAAVPDGMGSM